eukprot:1195220-Prorocentrum_minimum.AAC.3
MSPSPSGCAALSLPPLELVPLPLPKHESITFRLCGTEPPPAGADTPPSARAHLLGILDPIVVGSQHTE